MNVIFAYWLMIFGLLMFLAGIIGRLENLESEKLNAPENGHLVASTLSVGGDKLESLETGEPINFILFEREKEAK